MTSPAPGFTYPSPRTWSAQDDITVPRLRGDMTNLALLFAGGGRPILAAQCGIQSITTGTRTPMQFTATGVNTWSVPVIGSSPNYAYDVPLAGWYLAEADVIYPTLPAGPSQFRYLTGFNAVVNGAGLASTDAGAVPASTSTSTPVGAGGAELYQLNTFANTGDTLGWYGLQDTGSTISGCYGSFTAEWVGLPTSGLTSYTGPYGTVVSSPAAAAPFPSGPGTTLASPVSVGATSITVGSNTGMIVGGTLGLDVTAGQLFQVTGEAVTITSVAGTTIGISAAVYAHVQGAPVAVPVSAAFLNQQCRDAVNFLAYPPMCRATPQSTQSIPATTFPTGTQVTGLTATLDNFSGFASNAYTAPVAGTYYVYGQVFYAGTTTNSSYSAGIQVASGTIQWGTLFKSDTTSGVQLFCATVRRVLRLTKGQAITLWAFQNSGGGAMSTVVNADAFSRLIVVWRSV